MSNYLHQHLNKLSYTKLYSWKFSEWIYRTHTVNIVCFMFMTVLWLPVLSKIASPQIHCEAVLLVTSWQFSLTISVYQDTFKSQGSLLSGSRLHLHPKNFHEQNILFNVTKLWVKVNTKITFPSITVSTLISLGP